MGNFFFTGLPRDHPESYHTFMWNNFFKHIDIHPKNVNLLDGNATDLEEECRNYEKKIKEAGGIDLFIGGQQKNNLVTFYLFHFNVKKI